ncbi:MAG TPA: sodium:solute symporter, partial [Acidobacteriota bacterium]|nr:sodium:solute symporter [Acidobacteriota bacterium]
LWLGERVGRGQGTVEDYFLAGRRMPWWSTCLSIVGTETSTLTFVGVPAIAYAGDLTFLQVAMGYVVGRLLVAWLLVPAYFAGRIETAYELLARRFGAVAQRVASMIFLLSRCLADGVRLFATALVLQALLPMPLWLAVTGVSVVTLVYTLRGGLRAVIWNDAVQLIVYLSGAVLAFVLLVWRIPGGWEGARAVLEPLAKLRVFDMAWTWSNPYVFWAGLIGGATLTMATHGTDQMFVQRLLACGSARQARRAVVASGVLVLAQLALFLVLGSLLFVFYELHPPSHPFTSNDQVFPRFIAEQMPPGIGGLVIAAVFAAAMSTLSSSMSSVASAATLDFALRSQDQRVESRALRASRWYTVGAAVTLAMVAALARAWGSVLEAGLTITSVTFGGVLGVFLLAGTSWRVRETHVAIALLAGVGAALFAQQQTALAWTWLAPLGATITFAVGASFAMLSPIGEA